MSKVAGRYTRATGSERLTLTEAMVLEKGLDRVDESRFSGLELRAWKNARRKIRGTVARTCELAESSVPRGEVQHRLFPLDIRGA
jgi:hypothetical protein